MSFLAEVLDLFIGVGFKYFERPYAFLLLIPAILLLVYFFMKDFVKLHISRIDEMRKKRLGVYIFITSAQYHNFLCTALRNLFG